ncbi:hypothetical protein Ciccas_008299 [Cichlidogyrus casuarinus]|uniref:G-protein coupled receptors family 1 profile domain-containing protein n=1 Tax=Cichlidogyrus casuarinus TaxID=1844966 RepID=A0ABD2Q1L1_9PLAT
MGLNYGESNNTVLYFTNCIVGTYAAVLIVLGTIGNVGFGLIILRDRRRIKSTTRLMFILMAISDTFVLWFKALRYWILTTFSWDFREHNLALCQAHVFVVYFVSNLAILIFGVLCVDRSIVICSSLRSIKVNLRPVLENMEQGEKPEKTDQNLVRASSTRLARAEKSNFQQQNSIINATSGQSVNSLQPTESCYTESSFSVPKCCQRFDKIWHSFQYRYTQNTYLLWMIFLFGIVLILAKHLPYYASLEMDMVNGSCSVTAKGKTREYVEFATQAILPFIFIIPANVLVYRAIKKHQSTLIALNLSACRGGSVYTGMGKNRMPYTFRFAPMYARNTISAETTLTEQNRKKLGNFQSSPQRPPQMILTNSPQISNGHLFVFKTLIALSVLNFGISFPGAVFCMLTQKLESNYQHLMYNTLMILSDTHYGASFYVLFFTVKGFRRRFIGNARRGKLCRCIRTLFRPPNSKDDSAVFSRGSNISTKTHKPNKIQLIK